jgi:hypothetical protein
MFILVYYKRNHVLNLKTVSASLEAFSVVMFQVEVFWGVTQCSVVVGYQRFRGPCCLHPTIIPYGITPQETSTLNLLLGDISFL